MESTPHACSADGHIAHRHLDVHVLCETITMGITRCPMVDVTITMVITKMASGWIPSLRTQMESMSMEPHHTQSVVDGLEPRAGGAELRCTGRGDNSSRLCPTTEHRHLDVQVLCWLPP